MKTEESRAFTAEQQEYLKGFFAAVSQRPDAQPFVGETADGRLTRDASAAGGGNLAEPSIHGVPLEDVSKEERIKFEQHGLDIWETMLDNAARDKFPEGGDVFRYKFHGLFYVAPAQDSLMLRCRIPGCVLRADQLEGIAGIAEDCGGGYAHVTTRGNIQVREIAARESVDVLLRLRDLGLTSQGSGADNVRNITASPTSGFDPDEVCDVLPLARAMHHFILNNREMYDLPRKFNIAFDNGGAVSVCADTNDLGFYAVRVTEPRDATEPGVYFRLQLCGITGHKQLAFDSGILLKPEECVPTAAAMLRVFLRHGDRTNRKKARMKYLVDKWGVEKFLEETEKLLAFPLRRVPLEACEPRRPIDKHGYIGAHPQKQDGFSYVGVAVPVGYLDPSQMRGLARLAREYGHGEIRLTVWQNVILPHIPEDRVDALRGEIRKLGLGTQHHPVVNGLVACTGNRGCRYAATDTKGHAVALGEYLRDRVGLDQPVNLHLTGCPHSCAQHYIGDIGMLGAKVKTGNGDESVEGYHIVLGGGVDDRAGIAREIFSAIPFHDVPPLVETMLSVYQENRHSPDETFTQWSRRHEVDELKTLFSAAQPAKA